MFHGCILSKYFRKVFILYILPFLWADHVKLTKGCITIGQKKD